MGSTVAITCCFRRFDAEALNVGDVNLAMNPRGIDGREPVC